MSEMLNTPPGLPERIEETRQDDAQAVAWRADAEGREPFAEAAAESLDPRAAEAGPDPGHVPISALLDESSTRLSDAELERLARLIDQARNTGA